MLHTDIIRCAIVNKKQVVGKQIRKKERNKTLKGVFGFN